MNDSVPEMKKLLIPMWTLVLISLLILATLVSSRFAPTVVSPSHKISLPDNRSIEEDDFFLLPIEKQVGMASVIARSEWKLEGDVYKCVIAEILKQKPGALFPYKIGDEYSPGNQSVKPNTVYGDGQVLFFTGAPPRLRFITAISDGRLIGSGDVRLDGIRELIPTQK